MSAPCNWDVDPGALGVCSEWSSHTEAIRSAALSLATDHLWGSTGRRFGVCPLEVRPAQDQFWDPTYRAYPVQMTGRQFGDTNGGISAPMPYLDSGVWRNCGCGPRCCCRPECATVLRGPVHSILEVTVDGSVIPPGDYRVDVTQGTYWLVRLDGTCWPTCQDFQAAEDAEGAFVVRYERGRELPDSLEVATAILACEFAKKMSGGNCRLSSRMQSLTRQGVTVEMEPATPGDMWTGIEEVNQVIRNLNPSRRTRPPVVLSPDLPESCDRMTVFGPGS